MDKCKCLQCNTKGLGIGCGGIALLRQDRDKYREALHKISGTTAGIWLDEHGYPIPVNRIATEALEMANE